MNLEGLTGRRGKTWHLGDPRLLSRTTRAQRRRRGETEREKHIVTEKETDTTWQLASQVQNKFSFLF
jgi:hypothetical protein